MKEEIIELKPIKVLTSEITIVGDSKLILNKMNDRTKRALLDARRGKAVEKREPNDWEDRMTAIHWRDGQPTDFTEEGMKDALKNNAPCINTFGLMKSFKEAVVRNEIDKFSTKFGASVNIVEDYIPVTFAKCELGEMLISPKKGAPVRSLLTYFDGWSATFTIRYIEGGVYSLEQIINIINLAGFGLGIGSGRINSGYGRYHVGSVK